MAAGRQVCKLKQKLRAHTLNPKHRVEGVNWECHVAIKLPKPTVAALGCELDYIWN